MLDALRFFLLVITLIILIISITIMVMVTIIINPKPKPYDCPWRRSVVWQGDGNLTIEPLERTRRPSVTCRQRPIVYWGQIGITEKKMETAIVVSVFLSFSLYHPNILQPLEAPPASAHRAATESSGKRAASGAVNLDPCEESP